MRTLKDPKEGKEEELRRPTHAFAYPHHISLTLPCIFPSQYPLTPAYSPTGGPQGLQNLMLLSLLYLFWWRFL
jgi:hypothetical protein